MWIEKRYGDPRHTERSTCASLRTLQDIWGERKEDREIQSKCRGRGLCQIGSVTGQVDEPSDNSDGGSLLLSPFS